MFEIGDALLFTLSGWRRCTWQAFRRAVDDFQIGSLCTGRGVPGEPDPRVRLNAARLLDALGHCDVVFGATNKTVFTAPSVLARLPVAGLPHAVLCGSRSPDSLRAFREAARRTGRSLRVQASSQVSSSPFAPTRIEVQATSDAVTRRIAEDVGVIYEAVPPAWSLVTLSGSVEEFLESLDWSQRPDMNWPRSDFDPEQLRFAGRRDPQAPLVLSRYQDPVRGQAVFWLWRGAESAEVDDLSWGRCAVLAAFGRAILQYNATRGELMVPASVPLPRLLSRAATLCSGYAPFTVSRPGHASGGVSVRFQVYRSVPPDVYRVCAAKAGQRTSKGPSLNDATDN